MKWMIASDLHGSAYYAEKLWEAFEREKADKLLFLGDLLYHGPRNDYPKDYDTKRVTALMNAHKQEIICVRGNCDSEVDQMVLEFPIMTDYAILAEGKRMIFVTHGHLFDEDNPPMLGEGDILLHGHTHVQVCEEREHFIYMNPGSLSLPKNGSAHGYMILEDGEFLWKDVESGEICLRFTL